MARQGTAVVRDNYLHLRDCQPIRLGSAAWFAWLQTATRFSYYAPTSDRLTFRKEKRRHGHYWYAYLKRNRKLHNAYAGRSTALTADRLMALVVRFQQEMQR